MNTSIESLTHKMQRAAVGKMVDVVLSHADKDRQKTVGQLVDVAKQFYGSSFSDEAYEHARQTLTDPDSKWSKLINCVLDQTDPNVARTIPKTKTPPALLPREWKRKTPLTEELSSVKDE